MRKTKVIFSVLAALCLMMFGAQAANAQGLGGTGAPLFTANPDFSGDNTGPAAGQHVFTTNGGGLVVRCNTVTNRGNVDTAAGAPRDASGDPQRATFRIAFSNCSASLAGLNFPATVTVNCDWTATITSFNSATGQNAGFLTIPCTTVIAITGAGCSVVVNAQTVPVTSQNVTATGANSPANGAPAGMVLTVGYAGITFTTNCPGVQGPASYTGKKWERGVWAVV